MSTFQADSASNEKASLESTIIFLENHLQFVAFGYLRFHKINPTDIGGVVAKYIDNNIFKDMYINHCTKIYKSVTANDVWIVKIIQSKIISMIIKFSDNKDESIHDIAIKILKKVETKITDVDTKNQISEILTENTLHKLTEAGYITTEVWLRDLYKLAHVERKKHSTMNAAIQLQSHAYGRWTQR